MYNVHVQCTCTHAQLDVHVLYACFYRALGLINSVETVHNLYIVHVHMHNYMYMYYMPASTVPSV